MVTATNEQDELFPLPTVDLGFSPTLVDLSAPGDSYPSTQYTSSKFYSNTFRSTSAAAPLVTGTVGLMYALDCERFAELAEISPATAAKVVKRAVLLGVDQTPYLASRVSSSGRLNVAGALEALLTESCIDGEFVVQFESSDQARETFTSTDGTGAQRIRSLSEDWGLYLYEVSDKGSRAAALALLEAQPGLLGVEQNFSMQLRSRFPDDAGWGAQDALRQIRTPQAWQNVYGDDDPEPSDVVTAVFDQEFRLGVNDLEERITMLPTEIPDNGRDDDGNGYVDDYSGYNFTEQLPARLSDVGNHGLGMTSLLVAPANDQANIAGVDWAGSVLPLQGQTLADWVEAANYIAGLRDTYESTGGFDGANVVSYLTPQGGSRALLGGPQGGVVNGVLDELMESGILTVGAMPNDSTDLALDFPASVSTSGLIRVGATDSIGQPLQSFPYDSTYAADITAPGQRVVYTA